MKQLKLEENESVQTLVLPKGLWLVGIKETLEKRFPHTFYLFAERAGRVDESRGLLTFASDGEAIVVWTYRSSGTSRFSDEGMWLTLKGQNPSYIGAKLYICADPIEAMQWLQGPEGRGREPMGDEFIHAKD